MSQKPIQKKSVYAVSSSRLSIIISPKSLRLPQLTNFANSHPWRHMASPFESHDPGPRGRRKNRRGTSSRLPRSSGDLGPAAARGGHDAASSFFLDALHDRAEHEHMASKCCPEELRNEHIGDASGFLSAKADVPCASQGTFLT